MAINKDLLDLVGFDVISNIAFVENLSPAFCRRSFRRLPIKVEVNFLNAAQMLEATIPATFTYSLDVGKDRYTIYATSTARRFYVAIFTSKDYETVLIKCYLLNALVKRGSIEYVISKTGQKENNRTQRSLSGMPSAHRSKTRKIRKCSRLRRAWKNSRI